MHLVEAFLNIPFFDEEGRDWAAEKGIPPVGLLTYVLLNFHLDSFDRHYRNEGPHFTYLRYIYEGIIISRDEHRSIESHFHAIENMESFMAELGIACAISSMERGHSAKMPFLGGQIFIDKEGVVRFLEGG